MAGTLHVSDGHGNWTEMDPDTPLPPVKPLGIPTDRIRRFLDAVDAGSEGHAVDPTGSGRGRWLAGRSGLWSDPGDMHGTRRDFLR